MEEAQAGAASRQSYRDLCRRSRDPVQERQCRRGIATIAQDHEQAEAHGQRGEDTNLQGPNPVTGQIATAGPGAKQSLAKTGGSCSAGGQQFYQSDSLRTSIVRDVARTVISK